MKYLTTLFIIALLFITACASNAEEIINETPEEETPITLPLTQREFSIGVTEIVPQTYPRSTQEDWNNLYNSLPEYGELLGVYSHWNNSQVDNIPEQVRTAANIAEQTNRTLAVGITFTDAEDRYYFIENTQAIRKTTLAIAEEYQPAYFAIGFNINEYALESPEGFENFIKQYNQLYDAVKTVSPETQVFTIFQYESLNGNRTILGEEHEPQWELLERFAEKSDLIGITSYPFFTYPDPQDIPPEYYARLAEHTDKPIFFAEIGWHSNDHFTGGLSRLNPSPYVSNEEEQVDFLITFLDQTQTLKIEAVLWRHIHDLRGERNILNFAGLKENNGEEKMIYAYWQKLESL